jgi:hypothetical protein
MLGFSAAVLATKILKKGLVKDSLQETLKARSALSS